MQTKHLCVLIHIWTKGEAGAPLIRLKPSSIIFFTDCSKAVLLLWIIYMLFMSCFVILLCTSVWWCLVVACWERAGLLAIICGVYLRRNGCHLPIGILGQVWCLIVSIPDLCPLFYFHLYVLLSTYLWFISLLYLDLNEAVDDPRISQESYTQTKHLCSLIHIRIEGEVATVKLV